MYNLFSITKRLLVERCAIGLKMVEVSWMFVVQQILWLHLSFESRLAYGRLVLFTNWPTPLNKWNFYPHHLLFENDNIEVATSNVSFLKLQVSPISRIFGPKKMTGPSSRWLDELRQIWSENQKMHIQTISTILNPGPTRERERVRDSDREKESVCKRYCIYRYKERDIESLLK